MFIIEVALHRVGLVYDPQRTKINGVDMVEYACIYDIFVFLYITTPFSLTSLSCPHPRRRSVTNSATPAEISISIDPRKSCAPQQSRTFSPRSIRPTFVNPTQIQAPQSLISNYAAQHKIHQSSPKTSVHRSAAGAAPAAQPTYLDPHPWSQRERRTDMERGHGTIAAVVSMEVLRRYEWKGRRRAGRSCWGLRWEVGRGVGGYGLNLCGKG